MKKKYFLSILFFVFAFPLHAQVFETVCPTGTVSIQSLQTTDNVTGKIKQNACVDNSGNLSLTASTTGTVNGVGIHQQNFATAGGPFTFTIPAGVTQIKATVIAGGGSGGGATATTAGGSGGAGGVAIKYLSGLTPGNTLIVNVGAGGAGVSAAAGNPGQVTTLSSGTQTITSIQANPGQAGGLSAAPVGAGVGGATGSGGDFNFGGNSGYISYTSNGVATPGPGSIFGGGGNYTFGAAGQPGSAPGAGGGGGGQGANQPGGNGAPGMILIEWVQ